MTGAPTALARRLFDWRAYPGQVVLVGLLTVASALSEGIGLVLLVPLLGQLGPSQAIAGGLASKLGLPTTLEGLLLAFVALVAVRSVIVAARIVAGEALERRVGQDLRRRALRAILHCDWRTLTSFRRTDGASLLVSHAEHAEQAVQAALAALANATTLLALIIVAIALTPQTTVAVAAGGVAVYLAYRLARRRVHRLGTDLAAAYGRSHAQTAETLAALRLIKSLGNEDAAERATLGEFAHLAATKLRYQQLSATAQGLLQTGSALVLALAVWFAVARLGLSFVTILPLAALFVRAMPLLTALQQTWHDFAHSRPVLDSARAMLAVLEPAAEPPADPAAAPNLTGSIALDRVGVRFAGADRAVLEDVSLTIARGETVALSGASGAGKSTLADLVAGLLAADSGTIAIDGTVLTDAARRAWRGRVSYVQQDPVILGASVRENLSWGLTEVSEADCHEALRAAAADFVFAWPHGLDTVLGDGGRVLSGGERQRVVLARGLLRRPDLLILDEATSALDAENERLVAEAVARLKGSLTILIIGHRGALAHLADRRLRLDGGRIVASDAGDG